MKSPSVGHSFTVFTTIDSTNMYAMKRIREGLAEHGDAYFALEQTNGRGQRGKKWWSEPGENIQMTLVLKPIQLASSQPFRLSATIALGVHDFLTKYTGAGWKIKWPNDLYWGDRKAGGILIENVIQSATWAWAVVGIGININSLTFDPSLPNPISLSAVTGFTYDVEELGRMLCAHIELRWQQLGTAGAWEKMHDEYNQNLYGAGKLHRLRKNNATALYQINRVDEQGHLIAGLQSEFKFQHGEVEWLLPTTLK